MKFHTFKVSKVPRMGNDWSSDNLFTCPKFQGMSNGEKGKSWCSVAVSVSVYINKEAVWMRKQNYTCPEVGNVVCGKIYMSTWN